MRTRARSEFARLILTIGVAAAALAPGAARAADWPTDLDAALKQAKKEGKPVVVDMWQPGCDACRRMSTGPLVSAEIEAQLAKCVRVKLDVTDDKMKLVAARYQPNMTPTIVYLSSCGAIVKRTEGFIEPAVLKQTFADLFSDAPKADAELTRLEAARAKDPKTAAPLEALADFWLERANWFEAVPHLEALVRAPADAALPGPKRLARWGQLTRAHATLGEFDAAIREGESLATAAETAHDTTAIQTAWLLVAFSRESQDKPDLAIKAYDRCIAADPSSNLGRRADAARKALGGR